MPHVISQSAWLLTSLLAREESGDTRRRPHHRRYRLMPGTDWVHERRATQRFADAERGRSGWVAV
jgi:hypothetical protein